jgi:transmembrane sensor
LDLVQDRETSHTINEAAATWVARLDRGPLSDADAEALETWLGGDPRRMGAFMRARALFSRTESAWSLEPVFDPGTYAPPPSLPSRRRVLAWGGGGAIAATMGALVVGYGVTASTAYATGRGEMRQVPLADGAKLTLNTLSKVEVGSVFDPHQVRLVMGEILVSRSGGGKAANTLRIEDWRLRAERGLFFLSNLPGQTPEITVHRGVVDVGGPGGEALRLDEGSRLSLVPDPELGRRVRKLSADQLSRELSWLDGQVAFNDERMDKAVEIFARYSSQPIVIRDPALARETVTGLFAAKDPAGFARAIGTAFGVAVRVDPDRIVLG